MYSITMKMLQEEAADAVRPPTKLEFQRVLFFVECLADSKVEASTTEELHRE